MSKIIAILVVIIFCAGFAHSDPKVPCYFIFGDSLSDAGNNNPLNTAAKANYAPYGVDFDGGATGRFTNGRTFADVLTDLLDIEGYIAPFSTASDKEIPKGVNYASGAAGIRNETGSHLGEVIWMDRQLVNHANIIEKLKSMIEEPIHDYLSKCLYTVNIGSNDYINNYFNPQYYQSQKTFTPDEYAQALIDQYRLQLKALYSSGARKIAVFGLGPIGCTPAEMRIHNKTIGCVDKINDAVDLFNKRLEPLVDDLNKNLSGAKFTFINLGAMQSFLPAIAALTNNPCCKLRSDYQCKPNAPPCLIRNIHAFMDGFHPTEYVNVVTATNAYYSPVFVHPVNIRELISKQLSA